MLILGNHYIGMHVNVEVSVPLDNGRERHRVVPMVTTERPVHDLHVIRKAIMDFCIITKPH